MAADPLAQTEAFKQALARCGILAPARDAFVEQGVENMEACLQFSVDDVAKLCKIIRAEEILTFMHEQRFTALRYWVEDQKRRGKPTDAELFTQEVCDGVLTQMVRNNEITDAKDTGKLPMPNKFTKPPAWLPFKETVVTYADQLRSSDQITPLSYIARKNAVPAPGAVYANEREERIQTVAVSGHHYNRDNARFYALLKSLTLEGPAWTWIERFDCASDGRGAFMALVAHYEGDSAQNYNKELAYKSVENATYQGERRNFSFDQYISVHQRAYSSLERLDEAVPDEKQVRDFLRGIQDNTPSMRAAVAHVEADNAMNSSFAETVNYISKIVTKSGIRNSDTRNVSAVHAGRGRGRGKGGRGGGRGGRGGNKGRGKGKPGKYYTADAWAALSPEEKTAVIAARNTKPSKKRDGASISSVHTSDGGEDDPTTQKPISHSTDLKRQMRSIDS